MAHAARAAELKQEIKTVGMNAGVPLPARRERKDAKREITSINALPDTLPFALQKVAPAYQGKEVQEVEGNVDDERPADPGKVPEEEVECGHAKGAHEKKGVLLVTVGFRQHRDVGGSEMIVFGSPGIVGVCWFWVQNRQV